MSRAYRKSLPPTLRRALKERYGTKCWVCGEEGAEFHHIIAKELGGTDDIRNFIPLCGGHHMLMHGSRWFKKKPKSAGRTRTCAKVGGYKYILDDYFHCRIGTEKCKEALGLSKGTHLRDLLWIKEYEEEIGIVSFRNNIDVLRKNGVPHNGKKVGWAKWRDGHEEIYFWEGVKQDG